MLNLLASPNPLQRRGLKKEMKFHPTLSKGEGFEKEKLKIA